MHQVNVSIWNPPAYPSPLSVWALNAVYARVIDPQRECDLVVLVTSGSVSSVSPWMLLKTILVSTGTADVRDRFAQVAWLMFNTGGNGSIKALMNAAHAFLFYFRVGFISRDDRIMRSFLCLFVVVRTRTPGNGRWGLMPIRTDFLENLKKARRKSGQNRGNFWNSQINFPDRNSVSRFSQVHSPDKCLSWCMTRMYYRFGATPSHWIEVGNL